MKALLILSLAIFSVSTHAEEIKKSPCPLTKQNSRDASPKVFSDKSSEEVKKEVNKDIAK